MHRKYDFLKLKASIEGSFFGKELKALQNGSDIRGIALDTEEQTATLTATAVAEIAVGVVRWLQDKKQLPRKAQQRLTISAIGHDSRLTASRLRKVSSSICFFH